MHADTNVAVDRYIPTRRHFVTVRSSALQSNRAIISSLVIGEKLSISRPCEARRPRRWLGTSLVLRWVAIESSTRAGQLYLKSISQITTYHVAKSQTAQAILGKSLLHDENLEVWCWRPSIRRRTVGTWHRWPTVSESECTLAALKSTLLHQATPCGRLC